MLYPKNPEYLSCWNGKISLPQGWASRNSERKPLVSSIEGVNCNTKMHARIGREVIATVQSSQRAADAVDKMIDAINEGQIPFHRMNFPSSQFGLSCTETTSSFSSNTTQHSYRASRFSGQKSRVRKIIDEFLEIAKKRGLYSRSPPSERYLDDRFMRSRSPSFANYEKSSLCSTQPNRQRFHSPEPFRHYDTQPSYFVPNFDELEYDSDNIFHCPSSPDLFEFDDRFESNVTFSDQSKGKRWYSPPQSSSQLPTHYTRHTMEPDDKPRHLDSRWWSSSQPHMWAYSSRSTQTESPESSDGAHFQRVSESAMKLNNDWKPRFPEKIRQDVGTTASALERREYQKSGPYYSWKVNHTSTRPSLWQATATAAEYKPLWIPTDPQTDSCEEAIKYWPTRDSGDSGHTSPKMFGSKSNDRLMTYNSLRKPTVHCVCCRFNGSGPKEELARAKSPLKSTGRYEQHDDGVRHNRNRPHRPSSSTFLLSPARDSKRARLSSTERASTTCLSRNNKHKDRAFEEESATQLYHISSQAHESLKRRSHIDTQVELLSPILKNVDEIGILEPWPDTLKASTAQHREKICKSAISVKTGEMCEVDSTSERLPRQRVPFADRDDSDVYHGTKSSTNQHKSTIDQELHGMITPIERPALPTIGSPPEPRGLVQSRNAKQADVCALSCTSSDHYRSFHALATSTPRIPMTTAEQNPATTTTTHSSTNEATALESVSVKSKPSVGTDSAMRTPDCTDQNNSSVVSARLVSGAIKSITPSNVRNYSVEE